MQLSNIIDTTTIERNVSASNKDDILRAIAKIAAQSNRIDTSRENEIFTALKEREAIGSTGFGNAIAIPHCHLAGFNEFIVGILVHQNGVPFDALDKKNVELFAFIIAPEDAKKEHIHILSKLSRLLSDKNILTELKNSESNEVALEAILRRSGDDITQTLTENEEYVLFHLMVQRENIFEQLVEVFSATERCSASIIRGDESSSYFGTVPLFKGFFADDESFNRIVVATLPKKLANETVRQIEQIAGDISKKSGVMVTVQELLYFNGSLNY